MKKSRWIILTAIIISSVAIYKYTTSSDSEDKKKLAYEVIVKNQLNGRSLILSIIPEGTYVKKGDLLVELDPSEAEKQKQNIELDVETSKASLITAENDLLIEQSTIESDQREARMAISFAQMDFDKFDQLEKSQQMRDASSQITTEEESLRLSEET